MTNSIVKTFIEVPEPRDLVGQIDVWHVCATTQPVEGRLIHKSGPLSDTWWDGVSHQGLADLVDDVAVLKGQVAKFS